MFALVQMHFPTNNGADKFESRWRSRFYARHRLTTRRRTNKKSLDLAARIDKWVTYHNNTREFLKKGAQQSPKYGSFIPENRYNVDQIPCPFEFSGDTTIDSIGAETVAIRGSKMGEGDKRMCTIQMCCRARGSQPRIAVIFRGKGQFLKNELGLYDARVDVFAQAKAWADRETSVRWLKETFKKHISERTRQEGGIRPRTLMFCDNLDAQVHDGFLDELKRNGTTRNLLVAGETEMLQPIDAGIGSTIKIIMGQIQDEWLDRDDNLNLWESSDLNARERRILITQWLGEAWERLTTSPAYVDTFFKSFQKTGFVLKKIFPFQNLSVLFFRCINHH